MQLQETIANLPTQRSLKRSVRATRQDLNSIVSFTNRCEIIFTDDVLEFVNQENILKLDSGPHDENRTLIFSNDELIGVARQATVFQMDGTFKVCPSQFYQLYTVHCWHSGRCIPILYCLLPNASRESYDKIFGFLVDIVGPNNKQFILDMEMAAKNSLVEKFVDPQISFCFYHLCQAHWRKIQEFGFQTDYGSNPDLAKSFRQFSALAFLPVSMIANAFDILFEKYSNDERFEGFLAYFETNFIGRPLRNNQRGNPRFAISFWSQHTNVLNDINRTNNRVEGWNRRLKDLADCSHPHIYKLLVTIKKDMMHSKSLIAEANTGQQPEPARVTYRNVTSRLKNILSSTNFTAIEDNDDEILAFLNNIAMIIKY